MALFTMRAATPGLSANLPISTALTLTSDRPIQTACVAWVRFKLTQQQELVIGGYTLPEDGRN